MDEETVKESCFKDDFCLGGKLLLLKPFNLKAMRVVFIEVW